MKSKNLLIVGATSGIMVSCLEKFLKEKYTIFATYNNKESLLNIPKKLRKSKNIKFIRLSLTLNDSEILRILTKNKVKADVIINAVGGSFGVREYPFDLSSWSRLLDINILKHILINNHFLKEMKKKNMVEFYFFPLRQ